MASDLFKFLMGSKCVHIQCGQIQGFKFEPKTSSSAEPLDNTLAPP